MLWWYGLDIDLPVCGCALVNAVLVVCVSSVFCASLLTAVSCVFRYVQVHAMYLIPQSDVLLYNYVNPLYVYRFLATVV